MTKGKNYLDPLQVKNRLRYIIENNLRLAAEGKVPIAMEVEGGPGTAKTSVAKQLSEEFEHHYQRLNLAEIEVPDLIGLPTYEYQITKEKEVKWVTDKLVAHFCNPVLGWIPSGEVRTSYAKPIWIHGKEDKPIILVLDDYNRVTPMMANACMTLIDEQRYISWALPKGSTIILTCNPSDEDFMVQQEDSAQATRRLKLNMKASVNVWASEFAESYGVDGRCENIYKFIW